MRSRQDVNHEEAKIAKFLISLSVLCAFAIVYHQASMSDVYNPANSIPANKPFFDMTGAPVNEMPHRVQAGASAFVLNARGELLLQKREDNGFWGMPGGRADPGESIADTCAREVWEETGFTVRVDRLIGVYSDPTQFNIGRYRDGAINQFVNVCFACSITGGAMQISDESTDIGFFPLEALPDPLLASHQVRIADARTGQVAAFFR